MPKYFNWIWCEKNMSEKKQSFYNMGPKFNTNIYNKLAANLL